MAISTIGSAGRDYVDLAAWLADLPATLTEQEVAEMYNDSEFVSASQITISGITTTATNNLVIRAASGQGFNNTEQALRYNASNGVAIRKSSSYGSVISNSVPFTEFENLQISTTGSNNTRGVISTAKDVFRNCVVDSSSDLSALVIQNDTTDLINCVIISNSGSSSTASAIDASYVQVNLYNCTLFCDFPSNTANGIEKIGLAADSSVIKNTAIFGYGTALESGAWGAGTDYNATDDTSLPVGSNNQTSLTTADQFENVASAGTLDLRLKAGNSLDGAGTPDSANTNNLDIFGNARSLTSPSIGTYETTTGGGGFKPQWAININAILG